LKPVQSVTEANRIFSANAHRTTPPGVNAYAISSSDRHPVWELLRMSARNARKIIILAMETAEMGNLSKPPTTG
jgi:hypothetical protein